jgi:hypothetical protein
MSLRSSHGSGIDRAIKNLVDRTPAHYFNPAFTTSDVEKCILHLVEEAFGILSEKTFFSSTEGDDEFRRATDQKDRPAEGALFRKANEQLIKELFDLVRIKSSDKTRYLEPLLVAGPQTRRVIATLNYDNSIELAAERVRRKVVTGIDEWSRKKKLPYKKSGIHLIKLHGSIDWVLEDGVVSSESPIPFKKVRKATGDEIKKTAYRPAVIFGGQNKLTVEGPFLELFRWFQREMEDADRLLVIGYSFRDAHINQVIVDWLNGDPNRTMHVVNGPKFNARSAPVLKDIRTSEFAKNRLVIHEKTAIDGIKDLMSTRNKQELSAAE